MIFIKRFSLLSVNCPKPGYIVSPVQKLNKFLNYIRVYAILTLFQLYLSGQFYWWRKPEYPEKTTNHIRHQRYYLPLVKMVTERGRTAMF